MNKNVLKPIILLAAGDLSQATVTSNALQMQYLDNVSLQLNATGTPTGTFDLQGSLDQVNFVSITLPSTPSLAGAATSILIDCNQLSFPYLRVVYTRVGGSGSLAIYASGKEV